MKKFIALVALVLVSASTMMYAQESNAAARRAERKAQRDAERRNSVPKKRCRTWQPINKLYRL